MFNPGASVLPKHPADVENFPCGGRPEICAEAKGPVFTRATPWGGFDHAGRHGGLPLRSYAAAQADLGQRRRDEKPRTNQP